MALSYPPIAPQRGDRTTFAARVDAFITWLIGFVTELIAVVANLNSIAAGGAYSIQYTHRTSSSFVGSATGGILAVKASSIQLDTKSLGGVSVTALLSATGDSTSTIKGLIRLQKVSDTSKWAVYSVTSYVQGGSGLYGDIFCTLVNSSNGANPFADGDSVMLFFDRTGDKGDQGAAFAPQSAKFSDRKATSTAGGTSTGNSLTQVRTLNTTDQNTIPSGVSLASNRVTVPAGTYDVRGRAPAYSVGAHRAFLWSVTSGAVAILGSSSYSASGGSYADSEFSGRLVLGASTQFEVRHYTAIGTNTNDLGVPTGASGQVEVYTEVEFIKVA